jgi:hypothetical protein
VAPGLLHEALLAAVACGSGPGSAATPGHSPVTPGNNSVSH